MNSFPYFQHSFVKKGKLCCTHGALNLLAGPPAVGRWQQMLRRCETWAVLSGQRQREFQEFPPDVWLLSSKPRSWGGLSKCRLTLCHLINSRTSLSCSLADFQIFSRCESELLALRFLVGQKKAVQTWGKFCFPSGFSASFPDILFPHCDSSLRFDWPPASVCACVCERAYPVLPQMRMLWKQAGLC